MSQSQIASTRSATAAEGRMLLEKPSMCSPPHLGGCSSSCESPIGCPDTTRKAPSCCKSRRKSPKPSASPHSALSPHLRVVRGFSSSPLLPLKHRATRQVASSEGAIARAYCAGPQIGGSAAEAQEDLSTYPTGTEWRATQNKIANAYVIEIEI